MSLAKVKEFLKNFNLDECVMAFDVSSATVKEAAQAIGCKEEEIAKTLSFLIDDKPILIVVAGDCKIDNGKYKSEFSTKAKMIPFEDVENLIGHAVGGVCPFAVNADITVYLDVSLQRFEYVYPACGSPNSAIKLSLPQMEQLSSYSKWIDVCKRYEEV